MTCAIFTLFSHAGRELAEKDFGNRRPTHRSLSFKSDVENETQHSEAWNGKHHAVAVLMNIVMSYEMCYDNASDWDFNSQPPALHLLCSLKWLLMNFGLCVSTWFRQTFTRNVKGSVKEDMREWFSRNWSFFIFIVIQNCWNFIAEA